MGKMKTKFVGEESDNKKKSSHDEQEKIHLSGLKGGQRVKVVEPSVSEANEGRESQSGASINKIGQKKVVEKVRGKKYVEAKAKFDHEKLYKNEDAIKLAKEASYSKFEGTLELHMIVKKIGASAQVTLPHQAGKQKKVEVASNDTIEKLKEGKIDFDILVATPDIMPKLVPFARLLGPKGLMPNPKNGTLINDPKKVKSFSAATITLKTEREAPLVHTVIGKANQKDSELVENLEAILKAFGGSKQIEKVFLKATIGPSVKVKI